MKLTLIAVGKLKDGAFTDLFATYLKRLRWKISLHEIDIKKPDPLAQQKSECAEILKTIPQNAKVIVCDERGKALSSEELANQLKSWESDPIAFVIGGADGITEDVRQRADLLLSFGRLTWPHQMVRVMLMEQVYRAQTILDGHPYHRS